MAKKDDEERNRLEQNRLVVAVCVAVCAGFILAMIFGALPTPALMTDEWAAVAVSSVAASISAYAVYLVAKTLKATRDTLDATREMAADQKRIGEAQIRPWVCMKSYTMKEERHFDESTMVIEVVLQNYGATPARTLMAEFGIQQTAYEEDENGNRIREANRGFKTKEPEQTIYHVEERPTLAPGEEHTCKMYFEEHITGSLDISAFITFTYEDNNTIKEPEAEEVHFHLNWEEDEIYIERVS